VSKDDHRAAAGETREDALFHREEKIGRIERHRAAGVVSIRRARIGPTPKAFKRPQGHDPDSVFLPDKCDASSPGLALN
jgi:hypothetical protein